MMRSAIVVACLFVFLPVAMPQRLTPTNTDVIENQYLKIDLFPGWTASPISSEDPSRALGSVRITKDRYVLQVIPIFEHASGVIGGRLDEAIGGQPSVEAVMAKIDRPRGGFECGHCAGTKLTDSFSMISFYTDVAKKKGMFGDLCNFPSDNRSAWFASYHSGPARGMGQEYAITLTYDTTDVDKLPKKDSPELQRVFNEVAAMLRTMVLKPPVSVSRIEPRSGPPGTTVTVYGSGFKVGGYQAEVIFRDFPNNPMQRPSASPDGTILTFQVPPSVNTISCRDGYTDIRENCVSIPPNHDTANDCPPPADAGTNFCGVPIASGTYEVFVRIDPTQMRSDPFLFTVTPPPTAVSVSLLYPNSLVSPGDRVTVRGSGFTSTDNTVTIGSAVVTGLPSADGTTLMFQAPAPVGESFIRGLKYYQAFVSNVHGTSNRVTFSYR